MLAGAETVEIAKAGRVILADATFAEATWVLLVKSVIIFALVFAIVPVLTVVERKVLGRFQARYGPNRIGPFGLLQPVADAIKLVGKEPYKPANATGFLWAAAPAIVVFSGVATLAILPWGDTQEIGSGDVGLYGIDVSIGVLYFFAFGSISFYGLAPGRLGLGLEVLVPGRDALRGAADLVRDLDGPRAARRGDDGRARSRSPTSSTRRTTSGTSCRRSSASSASWSPASPRPAGRRSTCPRPTRSWSPATRPSTAACASARS